MSLANQEIDKLAADWAVKQDLGVLSPVEQAEFEAWLAADVRHLGAYGRAEAVLGRLERLNVAASDAGENEAVGGSVNRRRFVIAGGVAASVILAVGVALRFVNSAQEETFATEIGQMKEVVLSDGSVVSLNTDSRIRVHFTKEVRSVRLLQGEVLFDVAKNKMRPFVVSAGDTEVRAVGTSFSVSMLPKRPIQVLVREGVVELKRVDAPTSIPVRAKANVRAIAQPGEPIVTVSVPQDLLARDLAWQRGSIALTDQTLEDAANEFARYSEVRIVVDPAVSARTVTGLFAANDPVGFAKAVASVLNLKWEVKGNKVRIF